MPPARHVALGQQGKNAGAVGHGVDGHDLRTAADGLTEGIQRMLVVELLELVVAARRLGLGGVERFEPTLDGVEELLASVGGHEENRPASQAVLAKLVPLGLGEVGIVHAGDQQDRRVEHLLDVVVEADDLPAHAGLVFSPHVAREARHVARVELPLIVVAVAELVERQRNAAACEEHQLEGRPDHVAVLPSVAMPARVRLGKDGRALGEPVHLAHELPARGQSHTLHAKGQVPVPRVVVLELLDHEVACALSRLGVPIRPAGAGEHVLADIQARQTG